MDRLSVEEVLRRRELANIGLQFHAVHIVRSIVASAAWDKKNRGAQRFLEVGAGPGWGVEELLNIRLEGTVIGIDVEDEIISKLQQKFPARAEFYNHDLAKDPLVEPVDFATATFVLDHVAPTSLAALCRNLYLSIRPGGKLVVAYDHHDLIQARHGVSLPPEGFFEIPKSNRIAGGTHYFIEPVTNAGFVLVEAVDVFGNSTGEEQLDVRVLIFDRP